ncbi:MAG: hypothetical protein NTW38_08795 [Candidatus Aminicenantes bacterium]|nr:hypothetical protein [Candidatus Aminicenantes bacterium]
MSPKLFIVFHSSSFGRGRSGSSTEMTRPLSLSWNNFTFAVLRAASRLASRSRCASRKADGTALIGSLGVGTAGAGRDGSGAVGAGAGVFNPADGEAAPAGCRMVKAFAASTGDGFAGGGVEAALAIGGLTIDGLACAGTAVPV